MNELKKLAADTPKGRIVCAYHIGMRPYIQIPVARYFVEVHIRKKEEDDILPLYHGTRIGGEMPKMF